jgi:CheY-like chemotaxis protein
MAGEPILIVDDTPVNRKLTRILLVNEGYKVMTASSAEEALDLLHSYRPDLVLADIQLPGMDGLEMTRRIKQNEHTRDITVIALTAFAMKDDERRAIEAGCDGYITRPIDTRTLGARIRQYLDARTGPRSAASEQAEMLSTAEMRELRRRFLEEGQERSRRLLFDLDGDFDAAQAARLLHQWVGSGGLLGYPAVSRLSREIESLLLERPVDTGQLRESLTQLGLAFSSPDEAHDGVLPDTIRETLAGKMVAMAGLPANESERLCVAFEIVRARPVFFELNSVPDHAAVAACDAIVTYVHPNSAASAWLDPESPAARRPNVFVGRREHLLALDPQVQSMAREFLMDSWQPAEALVRLSHALSQPAGRPAMERATPTPPGHIRVLAADDDPSVLAVLRAALKDGDMECIEASDGLQAISVARQSRPDAVILDVNMPGMDGYEVLAAIRREEIPARILLLTARQKEGDILRGFHLGADDYLIKPFSPMELVARLKRLLAR